ncbi:MAG: UbiX family flavin prenyltransferase, partial [Selenomonas sp.]|nr:UbiX family flavin prenyltransferase [Selenomonas sp.]
QADAMVVLPCSMKTAASIAHSLSDNLLTRAADVTLKEGRRLVLVPRETPMHAIHLENLLTLARLGVRIVPAAPGFYHRPRSIEDLVDMLVGKICDQLGLQIDLFTRWEG